jgi:hypothetical protein
MITARALFHQCRKAGIVLAADGDSITFDAPPGVAVPVDAIRWIKLELLAVLRGDYLNAAAALVLSIADPKQREALANLFDERAGVCHHDRGMTWGSPGAKRTSSWRGR